MRIALYLMTKKGFNVLNALINQKYTFLISEVIVGRDNNIDNDFADEIIALCKSNHINCFERRDEHLVLADYSIAISWRWLIHNSKSKLIVLHDSLLPKYRGFAPLVNMLINNEPEIGVSAIFASDEYDKGDIIAQSSTAIKYPIRISEAIDLISLNYIEVVIKVFDTLNRDGAIIASKQEEELATYSLWRDENDYFINWQDDASEILSFINAVSSPYKGAASYIGEGRKIRILDAELVNDVYIENRDVGKVIFNKDGYPVIVCKVGLIRLLNVIDDKTNESLLPLKNFRTRFISPLF